MADRFEWQPELGRGRLDVKPIAYDAAYFAKYLAYADTSLGVALTAARLALVLRHWDRAGRIVDVGIGSGQFVIACHDVDLDVRGADVCPEALAWLDACGLLHDLRWHNGAGCADVLTFWDSLEHMEDPAAALAKANRWAFVSLPVHDTRAEWLRSKHFRPGEHLWYWSQPGFARWAAEQGFHVREVSEVEVELGRENIATFALERKEPRWQRARA